MTLFYLLKFVLDRGMSTLHGFGDSLLVIKWMNGQTQIQNIDYMLLHSNLNSLLETSGTFVSHIYLENIIKLLKNSLKKDWN